MRDRVETVEDRLFDTVADEVPLAVNVMLEVGENDSD